LGSRTFTSTGRSPRRRPTPTTLTGTSSVTPGAWPRANSSASSIRSTQKSAGPGIPSSDAPTEDTPRNSFPSCGYRVELYPHYDQFTGITDEHGNPLTFPAAFRKRRRDDEPKGIVKVIREE
jgi:hypothetical protein